MFYMIFLFLSFETGLPIGNLNGIEVKSKNGDISISVNTVDKINIVVEDSSLLKEKIEGDKLILTARKDVQIVIPPDVTFKVMSISGDVYVSFNDSLQKFPESFAIQAVSGDIGISNLTPSSFSIKSVSGDINITGFIESDSLIWKQVKGDIKSVTGDITIEPPVPARLRINTVSGNLTVSGRGKGKYDYRFDTLSGNTNVGKNTGVEVKVKKVSRKARKKAKKVYAFTFHTPLSNMLLYNRVDGFSLGLAVKKKYEKNKFEIGGRYGFASHKWSGWIGVQKSIIGPSYLDVKIYSKTTTPDNWKVKTDENTFYSFLFKNDYYDYYRKEGFEFGLGLEFLEANICISYGDDKYTSLSKETDWGLFYHSRVMRNNPTVIEGDYTFMKIKSGLKAGPINILLSVSKILTAPGDNDIYSGIGEIKMEKKIRNDRLLTRFVSGYSNNEAFPFGFTLGGAGTLPGYSINEFSTSKFGLLQGDYIAKIGSINAVLSLDIAKMDDINGPVKADFGVGFSPDGNLTVKVVRNVEKEGYFKTIVRIHKRF